MPAVINHDQALFFRRRHQPRRPPLAKIRPGSPAPAMGPGVSATSSGGVRQGAHLTPVSMK
jgi:hypothetical protein